MEEGVLPIEMFQEISQYITDGSTWKSWLFTCKAFAAMNSDEKLLQYGNGVLTLIKLFPDKDLDWESLSNRDYITIDLVLHHQDKEWNWFKLSQNTSIKSSDIIAHSNLQWQIESLATAVLLLGIGWKYLRR